jgi:hypothetical protein
MTRGELALAFLSGGFGFAIADFVDRYMATYNPSTAPVAGAAAPTYFTGGTNGTLANTLNIATAPSLLRIGVGIGVTALPGIGAYLVKNPMGRAALQGMMLGAGIKLFSTLWNAYVMGNLLKPAATDATTMKASLGARLYPAEIVAAQNIANPTATSLTSPQGLNAPPGQRQLQQRPQQRFAPQPQRQVQQRQGVGDVGPFAVGQAAAVCPAGTVADSLTGQCVSPCWDGSTPAGGACPPQPTSGCGPSQVIDSMTGACANPCPDGSAPANGVCNGTVSVPTNYPAPQPYGPQPNGGWTKVNVPPGGRGEGDCGCGLADQQGPLPAFLGFLTD